MGIHERADAEADRIAQQLEDGEISPSEYDDEMRHLRSEMQEYERYGR